MIAILVRYTFLLIQALRGDVTETTYGEVKD